MKIALELQPCLYSRTGIGIYTYELVKRLQDNSMILLEGNIFNFLMRNDLKEELQGFYFPKNYCRIVPYGVYRRIWHWIPIPYRWLFGRSADITHFFNFIVPKGVYGAVVTTIYDVVWLRNPETMDAKNLKRIMQDIKYSIARADKIVTISESTKKDLVELLHIPTEKIVIVPPGVNTAIFQQKYNNNKIQQIKNKYNLPTKYILYMGTLEPRKNIERLVQAFAILKQNSAIQEYKLVLAGKKGWRCEGIFRQIKQCNLEQDVICTGYVDEQDKAVIYQHAELFLFPSLYEGFGMPILEAMAAGVPVVTSNVSSLPEVTGDAAVFVNPLIVEDIAEKMLDLLQHKELRESYIIKGRLQCEKYTWEKSADTLAKMYQNLILEKNV